MVAYNLISFGFIFVLYAIVKAMPREATLAFPHYALTLVFFLYQGTVFASYKTLFYWEETVEIPVALLGLIVIGYGFPYITWKWLAYPGTPEASEEQTDSGEEPARAQWYASRVDILFSPQGQWTPPAIAKRFGFFFDDFTENARYFRLIIFAFFHLIGLVAAFQATAGSVQCVVQTVTCAALCFTMSGVFAFLRPMRWKCLSFSLSGVLIIQGVVFLCVDFGPQYSEILSYCFAIGMVLHIALWVSTKVQGYYIHDKTPPPFITWLRTAYSPALPINQEQVYDGHVSSSSSRLSSSRSLNTAGDVPVYDGETRHEEDPLRGAREESSSRRKGREDRVRRYLR